MNTPTIRHPSEVKEEINRLDNTLMGIPMPRFHDLSRLKDEVNRCHALVLTAENPTDKEAAQDLLRQAHANLEEGNQVNASYEQAVRDRKVLTDRRAQLQKELEFSLSEERRLQAAEAEQAYRQELADFNAMAKNLCRAYPRLLELSRRCAEFGHVQPPPAFDFPHMRSKYQWPGVGITSEFIRDGELVWLRDENQAAGKPAQSASPVVFGELPMPSN